MALERLKKDFPEFDYELVAWAEYDPETPNIPLERQAAVVAHNAVFPQWKDRNWGDMTKIDWEKVPPIDLLFYSTPCITNDSLILTSDGYKMMKDIKEGDYVLTKSNVMHKVLKKFDNGVHPTCILKGSAFENIHCTLNHKFYVREMYRHGHKWVRDFRDPEFVEAKDLTRNHYFGFPVNDESVPFLTEDLDFWYMVGMYIGDGWIPSRKTDNDVIISCNKVKQEKLQGRLKQDKWKYTIQKGRTANRFRFANKEIHNIIRDNFGTGSFDKMIPFNVVRMPKPQLQAFLDGYIDSDGCRPMKNYIQFSTVNRCIAYTIQQIVAKLYHRVTSISKVKVSSTKEIEGRIVNQHPWYLLRSKLVDNKQDKSFYENGYIWYPFVSRTMADNENVYNMEIEEDHSYIIQGCMSKNCQSISQAGLQHGFVEGSGTRSSIIWNVRDALRILQPKYAILENVAAMVSSKFLPMFNLWRDEVARLGYVNFAQVLNAKEYGIPQNRERIFLVSIRDDGDSPAYHFPNKIPLQHKLADLLEETTDTKYYLNPNKVNQFVKDNLVMIEKYVREGDGEIEKLPDHLREWLDNYPEESDDANTD